jgi:uncharacterized protein (TIGR03435 family)
MSQEPPRQATASARVEFEVASVKAGTTIPMRGTKMLTPYDGDSPSGGLFSANAPPITYLIFAYKLLDVSQYKALHDQLPEWALREPFDIEARAEGNPSKDEIRLMMQMLLANRFKLRYHYEARRVPIYALKLDQTTHLGPHLQPHSTSVPCLNTPAETRLNGPDANAAEDAHAVAPAPPPCGLETSRNRDEFHWKMSDATMDQIASVIGSALGGVGQRPVVNRTGLSGRFDMDLEFVPGNGADQQDGWGPNIVGAIKNQLGLKLMQQTASVNVFVVDRIELPSAN